MMVRKAVVLYIKWLEELVNPYAIIYIKSVALLTRERHHGVSGGPGIIISVGPEIIISVGRTMVS